LVLYLKEENEETMEFCDKCKTVNPPNAKYCCQCGISIVSKNHQPSPSLVGMHLFAGPYIITRKINSGGFGTVYEATCPLPPFSNQKIALKVSDLNKFEPRLKPVILKRFLREGIVQGKIIHPASAVVYNTGVSNDYLWIAMEYIDGKDLKSHILHNGRYSYMDAFKLILPILGALKKAHSLGIVHRDIKPENIIVYRNQNGFATKIIDFGLAQYKDDLNITKTGTAVGTEIYMSPEQWDNSKDVDTRSDIYSLGICLYEMISGFPPFQAKDQRELMKQHLSELPQQIQDSDNFWYIIKKMLSKSRYDRYQTIEAIEQEIISKITVVQ
jgi:serine/threonine protein kinase